MAWRDDAREAQQRVDAWRGNTRAKPPEALYEKAKDVILGTGKPGAGTHSKALDMLSNAAVLLERAYVDLKELGDQHESATQTQLQIRGLLARLREEG